jgi:phage/plasmid-associated DNA primase
VIDPKTCDVLAMASCPAFDPNRPVGVADEAWKNTAIASIYEPGSTIKPMIVAWALEGAERLLAQDRFTQPPSSQLALAAWRGEADAVAIWVTTACTQDTDRAEWWKASALFERFIDWVRKNHFTPCSSKTFGARLRELGVESKTSNGVHYFIAPQEVA